MIKNLWRNYNSMNLSISVMAHPKRAKYVNIIMKKLSDEYDGSFNYTVVWDEKNSIHDTWKRSWETRNKDADYHLVIQDDAVLCDNFIEKVYKYLNIGLPAYNFHCRKRTDLMKQAEKAKDGYFEYSLWGGVAVCVKQDLIDDMISFCMKHHKRTRNNDFDDIAMKYFFERLNIKVAYPMPSLVDHRSVPSLIPHMYGRSLKRLEKNGREAINFIDNDFSSKSVCIIGAAPSITKKKQVIKINSFDVVCRINFSLPIPENIKKYTGDRCDVLYCYPEVEPNPSWYEYEGLIVKLKSLSDSNYATFSSKIDRDKIKLERIDNLLFRNVKSKCKGTPNMGILAISDILNNNPSKLYITGFDFYQSKEVFHKEYSNPNKEKVKKSKGEIFGHKQKSQMNYFFEDIYRNPVVQVDEAIRRIMVRKYGR